MAKTSFDVTFRVADPAHVGLIISLVIESKKAELVGTVVSPVTGVTVAKARVGGYANGKRNKGVSGERLALETLKSGMKTSDVVLKAFVAKGFANTSSSASLSTLKSKGLVERNGDKWELTASGKKALTTE